MLINLRNALMAGKRLPYDAEVEYLESTGTQYIDTGVLMEANYRMSVTFAVTKRSVNQALFGARISYVAENGYTIWAQATGQQPRIDLTKATKQYIYPVSSDILLNRMYTIERRGTSNYFDGVEVTSNGSVISYTPQYTAYLFAVNQVGTAMFNSWCAVASCQIWDANNTLVRDFIPVRVGTVGYLYDRVSGALFGNAGTGDFVLGPDVVPVEYIESHGTEWIDTGYVYNADSKFVCDAMLMQVPADTFATMFGALGDYNGVFIALNNTVPIQARFGARSVGNIVSDLSVQNAVGVRHKYELSALRLAIDDDVFTRSGFTPYTVNRSIWLCSCNDSDSGSLSGRPCSLRVYSFDINNGNTAVHKYRPVRVGTDATTWEGAMMDVLTRRIYRNDGTGALLIGPDVSAARGGGGISANA